MLNFLRKNPNALLVVLLSLWTLLNLITATASELIGDESYYWFIAKQLEWGYYDHPPLFALLNHSGVWLLGDSELAVRLLTVLIQPLYLYLFWTLVRTPKSDYGSALRYFLVVFSLPMLQIYGFVATADAPLLLGIAVTLWAFKRYANSVRLADNGYLLSIVFLALGFVLMAYAKYHGALVVMSVVISRPKLLIDWRFYAVLLLTILLYSPHLYWQYTHDFASLRYHLFQRHRSFYIGAIGEWFINFFGVYNPFLTFPFVIMLARSNPFAKEPFERLMRVMSIFILLFFLYSTSKGHVQPQWMLPMVFPIAFLICRKSERSARMGRYVVRTGVFMGLVWTAVHLVVIFAERPIKRIELFGKIESLRKTEQALSGAELYIMEGRYWQASLMNFYTDMPTYAHPSVYGRSSHYQYLDTDSSYYGRKVAIEIGDRGITEIAKDSLAAHYPSVVTPLFGTVFFGIVDHYIPTRKVEITLQSFPRKVLTGQKLALMLTIRNPYNFEIPLDKAKGFDIVMHIRTHKGQYLDISVPFTPQPLGSNGVVSIASTVDIPVIDTGERTVGFSLQHYPFSSWYNSKIYDLLIVNPKTRF